MARLLWLELAAVFGLILVEGTAANDGDIKMLKQQIEMLMKRVNNLETQNGYMQQKLSKITSDSKVLIEENQHILQKLNTIVMTFDSDDAGTTSRTLLNSTNGQSSIKKLDRIPNKRLLVTSPSQTNAVAFTAVLTHNLVLGQQQGVEYDKVITNLGNAYDPRHGHMTAPAKGLYLFSVTIMNVRTDSPFLEMVKNGDRLVTLFSEGNHYTPHSHTIFATLEQGDMLWIRAVTGYHGRSLYGSPTEMYNSFSGCLLFPL